MSTVTTRRTVEDYAARLRDVLGDNDSFDNLEHVEACAMDEVEFAASPCGDSDVERIAEVRAIVAALKIVRAERRARIAERKAQAG